MTYQEADRIKVMNNVLESRLTWDQASRQLHLSSRQIGRLAVRLREQGNHGLIHGLRGRPSNNRKNSKIMQRALTILKDPLYAGFGPVLAQEKLEELHRINLSVTTLRRGMIREGLWRAKRAGVRHRAWRPRRMCLGELVQLDASYHDWLEGRGAKCALIAYIDDATSRILYAEFVQGENTATLMNTTKSYMLRHGRPVSLYVDRHAVYKVWEKYALTEPILNDSRPMTQFGRAMAELGIELIWAYSPQAKGRVERSFKTMQDRLVKEMRLAAIANVQDANRFLWDVFIEKYNQRFGVAPQSPVDAHRPIQPGQELESVLCFKTERRIANDFTVRFKDRYFQILESRSVVIKPKDRALIELKLDGAIEIKLKGHKLNYAVIAKGLDRKRVPAGLHFELPKITNGPWNSVAPHWRVSQLFKNLKDSMETTGDISQPAAALANART